MIKQLWRKSILHQYHARYMNCISVNHEPWYWHCNLCDELPITNDIRRTVPEDSHGRTIWA